MTKMVLQAVIKRNYLKDCTQGVMELLDGYRCVTLELPDKDNEQYVSCIPEGVYEYFYRADGSNGECFELKNVANRTYVQIHIGNWTKNTVGCILPGQTFNVNHADGPMVTSSGNTLKQLFARMPKSGFIKFTS